MHKYFVSFLFSLVFSFSIACDCTPVSTPNEASEQAYSIFTGKVLRVETNWMSGGMKYSMEVQQIWKHPQGRMVFVNSGWDQDCGVLFKEGESYIVYAQKRFTSLQTNRCMGNKLLSEAAEDLDFLGQGEAPRSDGGRMVVIMNWTLTGLTLFGMLFLAFVVLRKKVFKRQ